MVADQLEALFASGRIVDLVVFVMAIEGLVLIGLSRATGRGLAVRDVVLLLVPGLCLMLALRAALAGSHWTVMAGWLLASLIAHLADVWNRWPRR